MKFSGFDGITVQGKAGRLSYLCVRDGAAELRDATHLAGKDTWETNRLIKEELGKTDREISVLSIGAAGERLVRFACPVGDKGHTPSHNGIGAVMGSKNLKAISVLRGKHRVALSDPEAVSSLARRIFEEVTRHDTAQHHKWGTLGTQDKSLRRVIAGYLPVKNYTTYGLFLSGLADTADSLAVIDKLIYRDKKITWDQLLEAIKANWTGYENLRQLCINGVPKYGNDDDFADGWAGWVMDTWYDSVDYINTQKDLLPWWGGKYLGGTIIGILNVNYGQKTGALPNGHINPKPFAETMSPSQGMDKKGPTAVMKSVSKLPAPRVALGGPVNLRLSPQLLATDRDLDNFVSFLRAVEELGVYHAQYNVVSSEHLRKAMKDPEHYKDLIVRVASYCVYFVELVEEQQLDIISRTEQQGW